MKSAEPEGLAYIYEVGDNLEVKAVIQDGEERKVTKTPVIVTNVGKECMGIRIRGKAYGRRFVQGFVFEIENHEFRVVRETKMNAVIECLDEDMIR